MPSTCSNGGNVTLRYARAPRTTTAVAIPRHANVRASTTVAGCWWIERRATLVHAEVSQWRQPEARWTRLLTTVLASVQPVRPANCCRNA